MKGEPQPNQSSKTDSELLATIGHRTMDAAGVREAWAELYRRHAEYLYQVCCRAAAPLGRSRGQFAEEVVCEVFRHLYVNAARKFVPRSAGDADGERKHVRAWLGRVAERVTQTAMRQRFSRDERQPMSEYWDELPDDSNREHNTPTIQKLVRRCLLQVLTDDERQIVVEKMRWWPSRMPPDALEELADLLGKSKAAIQKIYQRSLKKVEEALVGEGLTPTQKAEL